MFKKIVIISLVLLAIYFLQLLPARLISQSLSQELERELDDAQNLKVDVSALPIFKVFYGSVDKLEVEADSITVDGIILTNLRAEFEAVKLEKEAGEWQIKEAKNTVLDFKLLESDMRDYLATRQEFNIFENFKFDFLSEQGVFLAGEIIFFDASFYIQLMGEFNVVESERIEFKVTELALENYSFATELIKPLQDKLTFRIDFTVLPIPLRIEEIEIKDDYLHISG